MLAIPLVISFFLFSLRLVLLSLLLGEFHVNNLKLDFVVNFYLIWQYLSGPFILFAFIAIMFGVNFFYHFIEVGQKVHIRSYRNT